MDGEDTKDKGTGGALPRRDFLKVAGAQAGLLAVGSTTA